MDAIEEEGGTKRRQRRKEAKGDGEREGRESRNRKTKGKMVRGGVERNGR